MATDDVPARRRRALLIASATYVDSGLAALRAPTGDVGALAEVLGDEAIGGFEVERLVDESTDTIKKRIEHFFRESRRQDLLLFYFSGHGVLAQDRRFYFATASTELEWVRTTAIDDRFVNEAMDQSRARSIVGAARLLSQRRVRQGARAQEHAHGRGRAPLRRARPRDPDGLG